MYYILLLYKLFIFDFSIKDKVIEKKLKREKMNYYQNIICYTIHIGNNIFIKINLNINVQFIIFFPL